VLVLRPDVVGGSRGRRCSVPAHIGSLGKHQPTPVEDAPDAQTPVRPMAVDGVPYLRATRVDLRGTRLPEDMTRVMTSRPLSFVPSPSLRLSPSSGTIRSSTEALRP
jgi:hypothetical protein